MNINVHNSAGELIKPDVCLIKLLASSGSLVLPPFRPEKCFTDNMFASLRTEQKKRRRNS